MSSIRPSLLEPFTHVKIESDAVHVVVPLFLERCAKHVVVDARDISEIIVVTLYDGLRPPTRPALRRVKFEAPAERIE